MQIQRRLAAVGDVVYCTPGYAAPITMFDAATGAVRKRYEETAGTKEFVHDRGVLFVVTGDQAEISVALTDPSRSALRSSIFSTRRVWTEDQEVGRSIFSSLADGFGHNARKQVGPGHLAQVQKPLSAVAGRRISKHVIWKISKLSTKLW